MLDKFKKLIGSDQEAKQEDNLKVDSEAIAALNAELDQFKLEASQLLEASKLENEKLSADLKTTQEALIEAKGKLKEIEEAKAAAEKQALETKLAIRREKIVAAIGTDKADGLMAATEGLDDAGFDAIVSALAGSVKAEANTELFKEAGVDAKAKSPVTDPVARLKQAIDAEMNLE